MVSCIKLFPAFLALAASISAQNVLLTLPNIELSFYYDNSVARGDPDKCAAHTIPEWQGGKYLDDPGACGGRSYRQLGDDRAVSIGVPLYTNDLCGHHVRLTSPEGQVFTLDQGQLYVKDRCGDCGTGKVDVSGFVIKMICDGECGVQPVSGSLQNPKGWKAEILDTIEPGAEYNTAGPSSFPPAPAPALAPGAPVPGSGTASPPPVAPPPPPPAAGSCVCNAKGVPGCKNGMSLICQPADGADYTKFMWVEQPGQACSVSCNA